MELFKLVGSIKVDNKEAISSIDSTTNTARKAEGSMKSSFGKIGKAVKAAFTVGAIVSFEKQVISTYATYDDQMRKVQAVTGATGKSYDDLRKKAQELGSKTRYSATEAGEGMEALGRAGWDTTQVLDGIGPVLSFATANAIELGDAAGVVADGLSQFGMEASETEKFTDILSATARAANTDIGLLGESLKYVGPVAGALGYSLDDVSVALGLMANEGIKGSQAGNSLKNIITNLTNPTDSMAAAMDDLGISITDANGEIKPMNQLLGDMRKSFAELTPEQKAQKAATIAGKEGMAGLLAVVNSSEKDFNAMTKAIAESNGVTKEMEEIMDGGLGGAIESVKSAFEGLKIKMGEIQDGMLVDFFNGLAKAIQNLPGVIEKASSMFQKFTNFIKENETWIKALGISLGVFLGGFKLFSMGISGQISGIIKTIQGLMGLERITLALGKGFAFLTSPVGIATSAVAIFAGAAYLIYKNWDTIGPFLKNLWEKVKEVFQVGVDFVKNLIDTAWTPIANFFTSVWETASNTLKFIWEFIKAIVESTITVIQAIIQTVLNIIKAIWDNIWNAIGDTVKSIWQSIKTTIQTHINNIKTVIQTVMNAIKSVMQNVWNSIKSVTSSVWNSIKSVITSIVNAIKLVITSVFNAIKNVVTNVWNGIKSVTSSVWNGIKSVITNIVNSIKSVITSVFNSIKSVTTSVWNGIKTAMITPVEAAKEKISSIVETIKGFFSNMKLKLPKIEVPKLPKFSLEGKFGFNPPSVPKIGVTWNADGAIFTKPTIFNTAQGLQGVGEAGAEAVLPIEKLSGIMAETLKDLGYGNDKKDRDITQHVTINSPKCLSPAEIARENKKMLQRLALDI